MFRFLHDYVLQLVEQYYYINFIPEYRIFFLPDYFWFFLFLSLTLILAGFFIFQNKRDRILKTVFYLFLIFWFLTLINWFYIEYLWLKRDLRDFQGQENQERVKRIINNVFTDADLERDWYDFYDFLEFVKKEIPQGSAINFFTPNEKILKIWAQYWLYPDLNVVKFPVRYAVFFDIELEEIPPGFVVFKQFTPTKFILKSID